MMPGARFFFIARPSSLSCPMGGQREPITIGSLGRAAVLLLPAALYSSSWIFMHRYNM
jgi:hypothetical protein